MPQLFPVHARRAGIAVMLAFALGACSDQLMDPVTGPETSENEPPLAADETRAPSSLAGAALFVDPFSRALETAAAWRSTRSADASLMERLGGMPQAVWFTGWRSDPAAGVREVMSAAAAARAVPVIVLYNIPQRDCGSYSAGGSGSADAYRSWVGAIARAIGSGRAAVILEPDALAGMDCLSAADRNTRLGLLNDAVALLKTHSSASVYVDAGHPRWHAAAEMADRLAGAGLARADGFALNVSNFVPSGENVLYGEAISRLVGGKHFVIDTSRNGVDSASTDWCNPSGRGVGIAPTTASGHSLVDALLWIKRPGESDGACNGGPAAGVWWPEYALGLMQRATSQLSLSANSGATYASR